MSRAGYKLAARTNGAKCYEIKRLFVLIIHMLSVEEECTSLITQARRINLQIECDTTSLATLIIFI